MILITGGAYQGKKKYAEDHFGILPEMWIDGRNSSREDLLSCRAVYDFHQFILEAVRRGEDLYGLPDELAGANPDILIVMNELGCGIIPMDEEARAWREASGRLAEQLAERADTVVRVLCGLGMVQKNDGVSGAT